MGITRRLASLVAAGALTVGVIASVPEAARAASPAAPGSAGVAARAAVNYCTTSLPKVGTRKTKLRVKFDKKKIKKSARARMNISASYKLKGKTKKAAGVVIGCDGTRFLGYLGLKHGHVRVRFPKLAPGKHRILVRYLGKGKAKPANARATLVVKR